MFQSSAISETEDFGKMFSFDSLMTSSSAAYRIIMTTAAQAF